MKLENRFINIGLGHLGLQAKIGILVALPLVIIFLVFGYVGLSIISRSTQQNLNERLLVTQVLAEEISQQSHQLIRDFEIIADSLYSKEGYWEPAKERLRSMTIFSTVYVDDVFILDRAGNMVWNYPSSQSPFPYSLSQYPSISRTIKEKKAGISSLIFQATDGEARVLFSVPVIGARGEVVGVIGGSVNPAEGRMAKLITPFRLGKSGYAELVDENGIVMASARPERLFKKDDHADRFSELIYKEESRVAACHRCHEEQKNGKVKDVLAFTPVREAPWGVAVRQLEEEALGPVRDTRNMMLILGGPVVVAALYISWMATKSVVRPIKELTTASERIASGDLNFTVSSRSHDEIGTLALTFDSMRSRLQSSYQEIEEWSKNLEERVKKRTKDLSTILEASRIATQTINLESLLKTIMEQLVGIVSSASAGILYFYNKETDKLEVRSSYGLSSSVLSSIRFSPGEWVAGKAFLSRKAFLCSSRAEVQICERELSPDNGAAWEAAFGKSGTIESCISAPLIYQGSVIGCLEVINFLGKEPFAASDLPVMQAIGDQMAVAIENARLYEEVQDKEILRGELLERVISAQEEERKRIARELHDEAGQTLTALTLNLAEVEEALPRDKKKAEQMVEQAKSLTVRLLAETRRLISDLRPMVLDELGLIPALRNYAKSFSQLAGLDIQIRAGTPVRRLELPIETALYRIAQESLNNVAKHGHSTKAVVYLSVDDSRVIISIEDNGRGFDVQNIFKSRNHSRGLGLLGMQERVQLLGGIFHIESQPGLGTKIVAEIPLMRERVGQN